jgi:hypothetical protein
MQHQDILNLAYFSIDETNRQLPAGDRLQKSPDTLLLGEGSGLDSLSLISFIVCFEEALEQAHGVRHNFLEEGFLQDPAGPLKSIGSLVEFIVQRQVQRG